MTPQTLIIKDFSNPQPYLAVFNEMKEWTQRRQANTPDEIWLLEHSPVFTQGMAGKPEHILQPHHSIPVIQTDRGGQVTYHGPGQLMLYTLINLTQKKLSIRTFVNQLEYVIIRLLASYNVTAHRQDNAPGIYVQGAKICSIGLKVKHRYSYHGLALNVDMDLTPFTFINPCGFTQLTMTQMRTLTSKATVNEVKKNIIPIFMDIFGYTHHYIQSASI